jgi:hypothetical protein
VGRVVLAMRVLHGGTVLERRAAEGGGGDVDAMLRESQGCGVQTMPMKS